MYELGVAEANMKTGLALHALQRSIDGFDTIVSSGIRARLHIWLVKLNHICTGSKKVLNFRIDRIGIV